MLKHFVRCILIGIFLFLFSNFVYADPPTRVARISDMLGVLSFLPAGGGENDWIAADNNRPLIVGDRLWSAEQGVRAMIQIGANSLCIGSATSVSFLNFDDQVLQLQVSQGSIILSINRIRKNEVYEIDTPNVAFVARTPGLYRIDVTTDGTQTLVSVRDGKAEVFGESDQNYVMNAPRSCRFTGTKLEDYKCTQTSLTDDLDGWCHERMQRFISSNSSQYVSREATGYEDLDDYGNWYDIPPYGNLWLPTHLPTYIHTGWAPFRYGRWIWLSPWGWTWLDAAPWGFVTTHYGRWVFIQGQWLWSPGPRNVYPIFSPALVSFIGGSHIALSVSVGSPSLIGWFPIGFGEIYFPSYPVTQNYFININLGNTRIKKSFIEKTYNEFANREVSYPYRYQSLQQALTAIPLDSFAKAIPVTKALIPINEEIKAIFERVPPTPIARVAPTEQSFFGGITHGFSKPPAGIFARPAVVKEQPTIPLPFDVQKPKLEERPGLTLDPEIVQRLQQSSGLKRSGLQLIQPEGSTPTTPTPAPIPEKSPRWRLREIQHRDNGFSKIRPAPVKETPPSEEAAPSVPKPPEFPSQKILGRPGGIFERPSMESVPGSVAPSDTRRSRSFMGPRDQPSYQQYQNQYQYQYGQPVQPRRQFDMPPERQMDSRRWQSQPTQPMPSAQPMPSQRMYIPQMPRQQVFPQQPQQQMAPQMPRQQFFPQQPQRQMVPQMSPQPSQRVAPQQAPAQRMSPPQQRGGLLEQFFERRSNLLSPEDDE